MPIPWHNDLDDNSFLADSIWFGGNEDRDNSWEEDFGLLMFQNISMGDNTWDMDTPLLESNGCDTVDKQDCCQMKINKLADAQTNHIQNSNTHCKSNGALTMPQMADFEGTLPPSHLQSNVMQRALAMSQMADFEGTLPPSHLQQNIMQRALTMPQIADFEGTLPPSHLQSNVMQRALAMPQMADFEDTLPPSHLQSNVMQRALAMPQMADFEDTLPPSHLHESIVPCKRSSNAALEEPLEVSNIGLTSPRKKDDCMGQAQRKGRERKSSRRLYTDKQRKQLHNAFQNFVLNPGLWRSSSSSQSVKMTELRIETGLSLQQISKWFYVNNFKMQNKIKPRYTEDVLQKLWNALQAYSKSPSSWAAGSKKRMKLMQDTNLSNRQVCMQ
jgi:hypothetical protein